MQDGHDHGCNQHRDRRHHQQRIERAAQGAVVVVLALFMLQFRFQLFGCGVHLPQQVGAFRRFLRVVEQLFARFLLILVF